MDKELEKIEAVVFASVPLTLANAVRGVVKRLPDPVLLLDGDGHVFAASPAAGDVLQMHYEALIGMPFSEIVDDKGVDLWHLVQNAASGENGPVDLDMDFLGRPPESIGPITSKVYHARLGPEEKAPSVLVIRLDIRTD